MPHFKGYTVALCIALISASYAHAHTEAPEQAAQAMHTLNTLSTLKQAWASAKYQQQGIAQVAALEHLLSEFDALHDQAPERVDVALWYGITLSTYATTQSGVSALKAVTHAKRLLEFVVEQEPMIEDGLAYSILGSLYYRVPKWPIGFKNEAKAAAFLKEATAKFPDSIDANFLYAEYLKNEKDYTRAEHYYLQGLKSNKRPGFEVADEGRRQEISHALAELRQHSRLTREPVKG
ncbi:MAG: hypothetical protein V4490_00515 [Pseudomonadota bacterium]